MLSLTVYAQNSTSVYGIVSNEKGKHIVGVSVKAKNTVSNKTYETVTDSSGAFRIDSILAGDNYTFNFSCIGYKAEKLSGYRLKEGKTTNLLVILHEDSSALADVVITGYTTVDKKRFTGSYATLSGKELERDGAPDVTRMLEGQFAGVSLQNVSGTFGAAPKLRIRGATSLSGDNKPLWVIDGVVIEDVVNISNEALTTGDMNTLLGSSIAGISPSDIQDITILKDAAATALYGARAMNGVIVITTKKGRKTESGYPSINYVGNFSRYIKPNYADFDIMNSAEQMGVLMEEINKGYYQPPSVMQGATGGIMYQMYNQIENYNESNDQYGVKFDIPHQNAFLQRYANANTNWFDLIFKNSLMQEHALSVSSGTDKFQTYGSLDYLKDDGFTIGNNVERIIGNFRMNFKVGNKFKGEILSVGSVRNQRAPGTQDQVSEPVYGSYIRGFDINPYQFVLNTSRMLTPYDQNGNLEYFRENYAPFNILNELNSNYMKLGVVDYKIQATASYQILPSLQYSVIGAYRYVKTENQTYALENSNLVQAYNANSNAIMVGSNDYLYTDPDISNAIPEVVLPSGGFYNINATTMKNYYLRHALNFNKNFGGDNYLTAFASMEARNIDRENEFFDGVGYQYENGGLVNPYYKYFKQAGEQGKPYFGMQPGIDRFLAYMGQITYSYKDRYTITPAMRYDGSNKMGESKTARWLPTWNISGSWNINQESFWHKNEIISSAALRASYGLVGNIGNATNSEAVFYNQIARRPYINDQETLTYIDHLANSELTWEKQKELDLGTNLGFFNDQINLIVDYYKRRQFNLIGPVLTSGIGGEYQKQGNYASMRGKGLEITLNAKVINTKDFGWTLRFNYARNTSKITSLETDPLIWDAISGNGAAILGYPVRGMFSVKFAGLDHKLGYPTFIGTGPDKPITTYINLQSDDLSNLKYEGPTDPTTTGGLYTNFRYKGFTLAGLIKFSTGNVLRLNPTISSSYSDLQALTKDMYNRWEMPGDELKTSIPAILDPISAAQIVDNEGNLVSAVYPYNLYNYSTERVVSGDYVKLAYVNLSYNLSALLCKKLGLKQTSLAFTTNNIWTIYADKRLNGQDPEFYNSGGVALPQPKYFTFTLKIGL